MDYSLGILHELDEELESAFQRIGDTLNLKKIEELTTDSMMKRTITKDVLVGFVKDMIGFCQKSKLALRSAAGHIDELKSEQLANQKRLIAVQAELIKKNDEKLESVQTSVKNELKSWSDVVKQNCSNSIITPKQMSESVKSAVFEEERSRSLIIYGEEEVEDKQNTLCTTVNVIFEQLGEKPQVLGCHRVGVSGGDKPRPIKVQLSSSETVRQVLRKAKELRNSTDFKNTFISPDLTREERVERRMLVEELKKQRIDHPDKHFVIINKKICSTNKG